MSSAHASASTAGPLDGDCSNNLARIGRCSPLASCNMRQLYAGDYAGIDLAQALNEANMPLMLRRPVSPLASSSWRVHDMAALLTLHGDDTIDDGLYRGYTKQDHLEVSMPLHAFFPSLRNGSLPAEAFLFRDVTGSSLAKTSKPLGDLYERVSVLRDRGYALVPHAARGRTILSAGGWGGGRPFHSHGPALNALVSGVKHWFVRRPNASLSTTVLQKGLASGDALPAGWEDELWSCTQREGDLLWVPNLLEHQTLNFHDEVRYRSSPPARWASGRLVLMPCLQPDTAPRSYVSGGCALSCDQ